MNAEEIAHALRRGPTPVSTLASQLPLAEGFYAWWVMPVALPHVPTTPYPEAVPYELLYVGIAPGRQGSSATIRPRVIENHLKGNTGASTFRFSLASLLYEKQGWVPKRRTKKVVLAREDNQALSRWQRENAGLTWTEHSDPWDGTIEPDVIKLMRPPMNRDHNELHPFCSKMGEARSRFRDAAV